MGGMGAGLSANNPTIVAAFHRALVREGLIALVLVGLVVVAWNLLRGVQLARGSDPERASVSVATPTEPAARRLLRVSFGLIWVFDGILQGQAHPCRPGWSGGSFSRPLPPRRRGFSTSCRPAPTCGRTTRSAAVASVWIQVGIGLWLLVAPRGTWSRLGRSEQRRLGGRRLGVR